ncbi:class I lanthipeptide [Pedobacter sp. D749]|uniref:class I lanthipeptide n=1 Tax=Pedobacter sp. D749 TaxID=2856523 RepID=UPI001C59CFA1|nr:class I lanthipeptide [Pedobacter sp. D749]QXU41491.1 class I lanthipeptide [Pedobacter sp. D749]
MKKQLKTKLSLDKETVAKLNEEQMQLVAGGNGVSAGATIVIDIPSEAFSAEEGCGKKSIVASKTCPLATAAGCPGC